MSEQGLLDIGEDKSLLILDDDEPFRRRLARAMEKRGFVTTALDSIAAGRAF
ncbi:MAG: two-component system response regulator, partial [Rhodobacteraceae bacterium]